MKPNISLFLLFLLLFFSRLSAQDEASILKYLFSSSNDITQTSTDAISLAVDAVWEASGITGVVTTTGTLSQNASGDWTYSSSPNDKLNVVFYNGTVVTFVFYQIGGYTQGTAEDFKLSHLMDFNTYIENYMNMRVYSNTYPQNYIIYWQRTITGTLIYENQVMTLNVNHTGSYDREVSGSWAMFEYTEQATGTTSTSTFSISVNEGYWRKMIHDSNQGRFVLNTEITNNSSGNYGGTTYKYQNAKVFWAAYTQFADSANMNMYNQVIDASQWLVQGSLLKSGQSYGVLQFDGPVINYTPGPNLILHLNSGTNIFLHPLIPLPATGVEDENQLADGYEIMQNYPNPFNSSTIIRWNMKTRNNVSIKIFNQLGEFVTTVLDEERPEGMNEIRFESRNLTSGIYFYRITAGDFISVRKMVLIK